MFPSSCRWILVDYLEQRRLNYPVRMGSHIVRDDRNLLQAEIFLPHHLNDLLEVDGTAERVQNQSMGSILASLHFQEAGLSALVNADRTLHFLGGTFYLELQQFLALCEMRWV